MNGLGSTAVASMTAGGKIAMFFYCPYDAFGATRDSHTTQPPDTAPPQFPLLFSNPQNGDYTKCVRIPFLEQYFPDPVSARKYHPFFHPGTWIWQTGDLCGSGGDGAAALIPAGPAPIIIMSYMSITFLHLVIVICLLFL